MAGPGYMKYTTWDEIESYTFYADNSMNDLTHVCLLHKRNNQAARTMSICNTHPAI